MKRRIALLVSLVVWVLLGKAMAESQNRSELTVNQCIENTLAKNLQKQFGLKFEHNFRVLSCESGAKDCHVAQFQAFAEDGGIFSGAVSVIVDQAGNCSLANDEKHSLTLVKTSETAPSRLADTE